MTLRALCMTGAMATCLSCGAEPGPPKVTLAITGQALIKLDPRLIAETPFATVQPIVASADVAFTNFEMAVNGETNPCGVPADYVTITGSPEIPPSLRPGNTDAPHAVSPVVMQYLAGMGFDLMSLANNHAWDLGECGIRETIAAARENGVEIAGTGTTMEAALAPAYLEAGGITFALVASTTSRDERELLLDNVNGVWLGHQADWDRNLEAVREAAANADFVIYYQHLQLDGGDFDGVGQGEQNEEGHYPVPDLDAWQEGFAEATIDAGASLYLGGGHRGFDGVEWYRGRPIVRQFGGLAYHAMGDVGGYPGEFAFWGLIGLLTVAGDQVTGMEFVPLLLNEGAELFEANDRTEFLRRRGMSEVATGVMADSILGRFRELSNAYDTPVVVRDGRAFVREPGRLR